MCALSSPSPSLSIELWHCLSLKHLVWKQAKWEYFVESREFSLVSFVADFSQKWTNCSKKQLHAAFTPNCPLTFPKTVRHGLGSNSGCSSFTTPTQPYSYRSSSSLLLHSPSGCIWKRIRKKPLINRWSSKNIQIAFECLHCDKYTFTY